MSILSAAQIEAIRRSLYSSWDTCTNCMPWEGGPIWIVDHEDLEYAVYEAIVDCDIKLGMEPNECVEELLSELTLSCPTCGTNWDSLPMEVGRPLNPDWEDDDEYEDEEDLELDDEVEDGKLVAVNPKSSLESEGRLTISVPRLNDHAYDFGRLIGMWKESLGYRRIVTFEFSGCDFLRPNAVAFIGGLARLIWSRAGLVIFDWESLTDYKVRANLEQNGFLHMFSKPMAPSTGNSVPYREDYESDANAFADYLSDKWLGRGWVHISDALKDEIVDRVLEVYLNAFEHSGSEVGVFSCGQHYPNQHQLTLALVDFGVGIPATVREYWQRQRPGHSIGLLTASNCLRWAFTSGATTRPNGTGRGMGLDLLKAFVQKNKGKLEVYSNEGYALINASGENYSDLQVSFEGTIAYITLNCDERIYCLASEKGL